MCSRGDMVWEKVIAVSPDKYPYFINLLCTKFTKVTTSGYFKDKNKLINFKYACSTHLFLTILFYMTRENCFC